jgi:hypothetical protein
MNTRNAKIWIAIALLVAVTVACGGSTGGNDDQAANLAATQQSLEATQAALANQPEPTQAPAATDPPDEPAATEEAPAFYTEEFDEVNDLWTYFLMSGEDSDLTILTEDGEMVFDIQEEQVYAYLTYDAYFYEDVRIDTSARNLGSNNNNVSLVCRETEDGWYEFNIANNGLYSILRYDADINEYTLIYNGGSTAINTGKATNEYTAICDGDTLSLFINGVEARTVDHDNRYPEGRVGISVSSFENVPVTVNFEWVTISEP